MKGLSRAWFRANAGKVIDIGKARKKHKSKRKEPEEPTPREIRAQVIGRAAAVFGDDDAAYAAAYVAVKERLLSLGFGTGYADKAAKMIATDYEQALKEPSFW